MKSPFVAAAFLGSNGTVYTTGCFHDVDALPADVEIASEGFMGCDGHFYSRAEATDVLHLEPEELAALYKAVTAGE